MGWARLLAQGLFFTAFVGLAWYLITIKDFFGLRKGREQDEIAKDTLTFAITAGIIYTLLQYFMA